MRNLRTPRRDDPHEVEGPDAFASEGEHCPPGKAQPGRSIWITAAAVAAVVVAASVLLTRGTRNDSNAGDPALLPARPALPRLALANPPAVAPAGPAITVSVSQAVRAESAPVAASKREPASEADSRSLVVQGEPAVEEVSSPPESRPADPVPIPVTTESVSVVAHARDRVETDLLLQAYVESYNRMDSTSMAQVWPTVDTAALSRAFSTLAEQHLVFDSCEMDFVARRATVRCAGAVRYVPRIGDSTPRLRRMQWTIELERSAERWHIAGMSVR